MSDGKRDDGGAAFDARLEELGMRVSQFASLELPGQPRGMHMGTSYLVHDLWQALKDAQTMLRARPRED